MKEQIEAEKRQVLSQSSWAEGEFREIELGDQRLEKRFIRVCEDLSGQPEYPINQASADSAATKAAYRLFRNERVTPARILAPHRKRTIERMRHEEVVLAVQDTIFFNFHSHKKTKGLGPIGGSTGNLQGMIGHSVFAVTPQGVSLGLIEQKIWTRQGFRDGPAESERLPIEEKESYRWIEALQKTKAATAQIQSTRVITVGDRESDIFEFLAEAEQLGAEYVIRAARDRRLEGDEASYLNSYVQGCLPQGTVCLEVPSENRTVTFAVKYSQVSICRPIRKIPCRYKKPVACWVIQVDEQDPPEGKEALSWKLLTNIPLRSVEDACEKLLWYRCRWRIEEFHRVLKSGCRVEDCRLQTAERLANFLTLSSVIAWRIFWMVHIRRASPQASAEVVLTKLEISTIRAHKQFSAELQKHHQLTVKQVVTAVARLGGYLNRRNDPPPGAEVLWRGLQRLDAMTEIFDSLTGCG